MEHFANRRAHLLVHTVRRTSSSLDWLLRSLSAMGRCAGRATRRISSSPWRKVHRRTPTSAATVALLGRTVERRREPAFGHLVPRRGAGITPAPGSLDV